MSTKVKPISFEGKTFGFILEDMTSDMNTLLRNMDDMGSKDGKFALTINVHLDDQTINGEDVIVPAFKHKIKVGFNVSHETNGQMDGQYVLGKNDDGTFRLEVMNEQTSLFDDEDEGEDEEEDDE